MCVVFYFLTCYLSGQQRFLNLSYPIHNLLEAKPGLPILRLPSQPPRQVPSTKSAQKKQKKEKKRSWFIEPAQIVELQAISRPPERLEMIIPKAAADRPSPHRPGLPPLLTSANLLAPQANIQHPTRASSKNSSAPSVASFLHNSRTAGALGCVHPTV